MRLPPWYLSRRRVSSRAMESWLWLIGSFVLAPWFLMSWSWTGELKLRDTETCSLPYLVSDSSALHLPVLWLVGFSGRIVVLNLLKEICVFWFCFCFPNLLFENSHNAMCFWRSPVNGGERYLSFGTDGEHQYCLVVFITLYYLKCCMIRDPDSFKTL